MAISAKDVAALRRKTGAGMMDCKKALVANDGDMALSEEYLQKKNLAAVGKRDGKIAAEGTIGAYVHSGRIGVIVEVNSETDFVGRGEAMATLAKDIAMHIAAANPDYVSQEEIPAASIAKQSEIFLAQMEDSGKPEHIMARIIEGKINKWKKQQCLLDQPFVKNPDLTVGAHVTEIASVIKEKISVRRFSRFELGQGIEKKVEDFAAEVAATMKG